MWLDDHKKSFYKAWWETKFQPAALERGSNVPISQGIQIGIFYKVVDQQILGSKKIPRAEKREANFSPISAAGCEGQAWSQTDGHWNNARNESHTWEAAMSWYGTLVHWSEIFGRYFWSGNPSDFFRERTYHIPLKTGKMENQSSSSKVAGRDMALFPRGFHGLSLKLQSWWIRHFLEVEIGGNGDCLVVALIKFHIWLPSSKLTWQWKIPIFNREYVFNWSIFHCHVSLPEGNSEFLLLHYYMSGSCSNHFHWWLDRYSIFLRFANFHNEDWYLKNVDVELAWEENHICIPGANKELGAWRAGFALQRVKGFGLTS